MSQVCPNLRLRHSGRHKKGLLMRPERNEKYIRTNKTINNMKTRNEQLQEIASVIYPVCIQTVEKILWSGRSCGESSPHIAAAKMAVRYANELVHQLNVFSNLRSDEKENY